MKLVLSKHNNLYQINIFILSRLSIMASPVLLTWEAINFIDYWVVSSQ